MSGASTPVWRLRRQRKSGVHETGARPAVRLLDAKVEKIRAGKVAAIDQNLLIVPVVVTYDRLATDHLAFYKWVDDRCEAEGLLQRCCAVKAIGIEVFEELMAAVGNGHSVAAIMLGTTTGDWRHAGLSYYLAEKVVNSNEELKHRGVLAQFDEIMARVGATLFDEPESV